LVSEVTYNWKIDFAIILAAITFLFTLGKLVFENRAKKKKSRIEVYEKVFDNTIYILLYPLNYQKEIAKQKKYENPDEEFQEAVRNYLNSNIYSTTYSKLGNIVPKRITNDSEKLSYLSKVQEEAHSFEEKIMDEQFDLDLSKLSPVNYFENSDIKNRFEDIVQKVGKQLSFFSDDVQRYWHDIITSDPKEVIKQYNDSLEICPNFFQHNPRGFSDPYIDILESIRNDYKKMTKKKIETFVGKVRYYGFRIKHPIQGYRIYKEKKS
jgi:hypothetical protein